MINEELTFQKFGYYAKDLKPKSNKRVISICIGCGVVRELAKQDCKSLLCRKCASKNRNKGRKFTEEHKLKISLAKKDIIFSEEHKHNISLNKRGVKHKDNLGLAPLALMLRWFKRKFGSASH